MFKRKKIRINFTPQKRFLFSAKKRRSNILSRILLKEIRFTKSRTKKKYYVLMLFFLILTVSVYTIFFSPVFKIFNIDIYREDFQIDNAKIQNFLKPYYEKNLLFASKNKIKNEFLKKFPNVAEIKITKIFPSVIRLQIKSYPFKANLKVFVSEETANLLNNRSEDGVKIKAGEYKYIINTQGQIADKNKESLDLRNIVLKDAEKMFEIGENIIPVSRLNHIFEAIEILENQYNFIIDYIEYFSQGREVHLKTKKRFYIWLSTEESLASQLAKLSYIFSELEKKNSGIEYVDLRIKNRIIYK